VDDTSLRRLQKRFTRSTPPPLPSDFEEDSGDSDDKRGADDTVMEEPRSGPSFHPPQ